MFLQLNKPEGQSLGFSVVGLRSDHKGDLGIFIQEIQPTGIAGRWESEIREEEEEEEETGEGSRK